ncbi:uncharacterized protein SCHCODRAFT_02100054 [Schizophyllum commune H4-8]|uniref:uncharacterized protein n=1 Tax=Schizophyllum commune (strain H4-8 / FGSC 9210) TaxID=578458 RepID=UPI00215FB4A8|nr:uncharacterized protein SCHCODRAFT_02100054 [Schizophyllum commune H4-8]KAI5886497.1 hypothetical protein SCHCODRAFT_02100054 [Schizophyllum commune H4-8]
MGCCATRRLVCFVRRVAWSALTTCRLVCIHDASLILLCTARRMVCSYGTMHCPALHGTTRRLLCSALTACRMVCSGRRIAWSALTTRRLLCSVRHDASPGLYGTTRRLVCTHDRDASHGLLRTTCRLVWATRRLFIPNHSVGQNTTSLGVVNTTSLGRAECNISRSGRM